VFYCGSEGFGSLLRACREVDADLLYLNSYHGRFTRRMLVLRRLGALGTIPVLLAPRGEFSEGAMRIKRLKKWVYRKAAKALGLYDDLRWHVTSPGEFNDLLHAAPTANLDHETVYVAPNITSAAVSTGVHPVKIPGRVKLVYMSRICKKKNLVFLLELLAEMRSRVELDIYGPVEQKDQEYWRKCVSRLAELPANVSVRYCGPVENSAVAEILPKYHFFVLPTWGENFCHAVAESLLNGTPVIISDTTPWRELARSRAGFDLPVSDRLGWQRVLQECVDMDSRTYEEHVSGAKEYSRRFAAGDTGEQYAAMFRAVASSGRRASQRCAEESLVGDASADVGQGRSI
jgi:glycosyltransferase involved in cell wall biosynthesis